MEDLKKTKSAKVSAKKYFVAAIVSFGLSIVGILATQSYRPTTQAGALIPGLLIGVLGWVAIICVIIGTVKWFRSRKK